MNIVVLPLLLMAAVGGTAATTGAPAADKNPVLTELTQQGIKMPEGTVVKLPAPLMGQGMSAAAQKAAVEKIMPPNCTFEEFTAKNSQAPFALKIVSPKGKKNYKLRMVNLYFVARGKWAVLSSKEFGDNILKQKKEDVKKQGGGAMTAGFLTDKGDGQTRTEDRHGKARRRQLLL